MISDRMALRTLGRSATGRKLHWSLGVDRMSTLAALIQRITGALTSFATAPALPFATLREAFTVVALIDGGDRLRSVALPDRTSSPVDDGFWSRF
jgi:hypothetical protein